MRALEQQIETAAHWAEREYDALFAAEAPPRIALVATSEADAGRVVGFVIARCATAEWEIENVVVAREERNRGIGIKIIRELLLQAQRGGATSVLLEVGKATGTASRLYEMLGFSQQGRRINYCGEQKEDAFLLFFSITNLRQFN